MSSPIELFGYQQQASDSVMEVSIAALRASHSAQAHAEKREHALQRTILLQAPTGSGKTNILIDCIERIAEGGFSSPNGELSESKPVAFIFLAPFLLHTQAFKRFRSVGIEDQGVQLLDLGDLTSSTPLEPNSVLFMNYASVTKDKNRAIRANEQQTDLPTILRKTRESGIDLVLVVDEAHISYMSDISQELVRLIDPTVILLATATPHYNGGKTMLPHSDLVQVTRQQVTEEEVIVRSIYFNDDFKKLTEDYPDPADANGMFIWAALKQRDQLQRLYDREGLDVRVLAMVQIPPRNADMKFTDAEIYKDSVEEDRALADARSVAERRGLTEENGKLAVWLSDYKSVGDLQQLAADDSEVEVLIYKAAAATGVDIPRAKVAAFMRDTKSKPFAIQNAGRIARQWNHQYYDEEALNHAYIYTAYEGAIAMLQDENSSVQQRGVPSTLRPQYQQISEGWDLTNYIKHRSDRLSLSSTSVMSLFREKVDSLLLEKSQTSLDQLLSNRASAKSVLTKMGLDWEMLTTQDLLGGELTDLDNAEEGWQTHSSRQIASNELTRLWVHFSLQVEIDKGVQYFDGVVRDVLGEFGTMLNRDNEPNFLRTFQQVVLGTDNNKHEIQAIFQQIVREEKKRRGITDYPFTIEDSPIGWRPPASQDLRVDEAGNPLHVRDDYYMYGDPSIPKTGQRPKQFDSDNEVLFADEVIPRFATQMEKWGYAFIGYAKQQDRRVTSYAVGYTDPVTGEKNLHYPDWFLLFKSPQGEQQLLFIETKGEQELKASVEIKAQALLDAVELERVKGKAVRSVTLNIPVKWSKNLYDIEVVAEDSNFGDWLDSTYKP